MKKPFIHLRCLSSYSLSESTLKIQKLVQLAKKRDYSRKGVDRPHRLHFGRRLDVGGEIIDIRKPINTIICSYAHCPRFFVPLKNKNGLHYGYSDSNETNQNGLNCKTKDLKNKILNTNLLNSKKFNNQNVYYKIIYN